MSHPCSVLQDKKRIILTLFFQQTQNSQISLLDPTIYHKYFTFWPPIKTTSAHKVDYNFLIIFN
jgi:hypothetical protein